MTIKSRQAEAEKIVKALAEGSARKVYLLPKEAWYADSLGEDDHRAEHVWGIQVESLDENGHESGVYGEFYVYGHDFRRTGLLSLQARVFHDAYPVLVALPNLLPSLMASEDGFTYEQMNAVLESLGFEDITPRTRPAGY